MAILRLLRGEECLIDDDDLALVSMHQWRCQSWSWRANRYVNRFERHDGKSRCFQLHRVLMGLEHGDPRQVDHISGDGLDNRRSNLRIATHRQNGQNRRVSSNNLSGLKGVRRRKGTPYWQAAIYANGTEKRRNARSAIHAAHLYDEMAIAAYGEFAMTNASLGLIPSGSHDGET